MRRNRWSVSLEIQSHRTAHRAIRPPASNIARTFGQFPVNQEAAALVRQENVPDTDIPMQDLCHIVRMPMGYRVRLSGYLGVNNFP